MYKRDSGVTLCALCGRTNAFHACCDDFFVAQERGLEFVPPAAEPVSNEERNGDPNWYKNRKRPYVNRAKLVAVA